MFVHLQCKFLFDFSSVFFLISIVRCDCYSTFPADPSRTKKRPDKIRAFRVIINGPLFGRCAHQFFDLRDLGEFTFLLFGELIIFRVFDL